MKRTNQAAAGDVIFGGWMVDPCNGAAECEVSKESGPEERQGDEKEFFEDIDFASGWWTIAVARRGQVSSPFGLLVGL